MNEEVVSLSVKESLIMPEITKVIQAAIVKNLGNPEELLGKVIKRALTEKVDKNGNEPRYSYDEKWDYLEWATTKAIQKHTREAIEEWLAVEKEPLKQAIIKELQTTRRQKAIVKAFLDASEQAFSSAWRFDCEFKFKTDKE